MSSLLWSGLQRLSRGPLKLGAALVSANNAIIPATSPVLWSRAMSVASSSSLKALESPFSHKDLYGTDHPVARGRRKSKSKHKKKLTESKSSASVSSTSRHKRKDAKSTTKPLKGPKDHHGTVFSPISLPSPSCNLAEVDADSPNTLRLRRAHRIRSQPSPPSFSLSPSKSSDHVIGERRRSDAVVRKSTSTILTTTTSSRTPSALSSSISRLSLNSSEQNLKLGIVSSAVNVRFNRSLTNINLPPYMKVARRAFETEGKGRDKPTELTIADIARGLGCLEYRHVVVMSGAGISTSSGIPDFR